MHFTTKAALIVSSALILIAGSLAGCSGDEGQPGPTGTSSGATTTDNDAGDTADTGPATTGKKKAAEVGCTGDTDCETNKCFKGNAQSFCTVACTTDNATTVCVAPYTGTCNKQGVCKRD